MDWVRHTTVIAALVAAAGLAVTAWGTLKSAQVADDQLAQSKQRQQQEDRRLASRITTWVDGYHSSEGWVRVVVNRSLDPAAVYLQLFTPGTPRSDDTVEFLGTVPPCTRVDIPGSVFENIYASSDSSRPVGGTNGLIVAEPSGVLWVRQDGGELRTPSSVERARVALAGPEFLMMWKAVKTSSLEECSSAT
ncbi:hypothetical protein ACWGRF_08225 [Streptomyces zhihengii]|uniref:hypothetical protein n=1 Tax=Streptomyces zhihengii TaxID=1818004 RepID=UPI00362B5630